jgi:hypothetical protein
MRRSNPVLFSYAPSGLLRRFAKGKAIGFPRPRNDGWEVVRFASTPEQTEEGGIAAAFFPFSRLGSSRAD